MTPPPLNDACLAILLACELLGAAAQTVHLPLLLARRGGAEGRLGAAFELLVAAHLYMAVDFTCCCAFVGNPYLAPVALGAGWSWRLWANAAAFACGAALAVRKKDPLDLMAAALLALCAPPAMEALGGVWNLVALVGDVQRHKSELTRFSIAETMNTVPVGALVVDAGGRSLLLNDSMRALLRDLGLPTDLGDLRGTWDGIARSARPARLSRGLDEGPGPRVVIDAPNGRVLLLKRIDGLEIDLPAKAISAVGVFSLDVTELDAATRELEGANEELVRIGQQLEERIAEVESIAEQAAYLRMRARVAREAVTNSCRRAQAHRVDIRITRQTGGDGAAWTEMLVTDDGGAAREGYLEGTGIPGMRRDMEELGGSLEVVASPRRDRARSPTERGGPAMIDIILVEDQVMLRESLAASLDAQPDMRVVSQISDAAQAPEEARRLKPGLVLMDVCTENDSSGIVAARRIKESMPGCRLVIMTGMPEVTFVEQARNAGVDSFVYKSAGIGELLSVIRSTLAGYSTFPAPVDSVFSGASALTEEEIQILRLVCEAKTRREIAAELYLSEGTVKRRIGEILAKTGYDNILRLAVHAVAEGSIVPGIKEE